MLRLEGVLLGSRGHVSFLAEPAKDHMQQNVGGLGSATWDAVNDAE